MHQVLHAYKLRLTNLSQGNRSLKLGRLSTRRDIDLMDLAHLDGKPAEDLLATLIAGKDVQLLRQLDPRHEPTNLADRRLNSIFRSAEMLLEESGTYDLHLGYPFVEGKFLDGTIVRCPVLLFPVRLERNLQGRPRWKLSRLDEPVTFNPTFFLAYEQYQNWRFSQEFWEEEMDANQHWRDWVQSLYETIKQHEIAVNFNADLFTLKLERFPDYRKEQLDLFKVGVLKFRPQAVLGIFPQSDSTLLQDYETIEKAPDQFSVETYFGSAQTAPLPDKAIREEDRYFALPVDASQEEALLMVKRGGSLVMHGPPGTGKSQVIVNLVTDALAHGKRVLVVSQKRAALDVVFKRLHGLGLSRFAMLVHDHRHDRSEIYRKLLHQIQDIEAFESEFRDLSNTVAEHDYRVLSRHIDTLSKSLDLLVNTLQDRSSSGISPHELYQSCSSASPWIDLKEPAKKLSHDRLIALLDQLVAIRDYREFFEESYPWKHRLSFRHYQQADRQQLAQKLQALPEQVKSLSSSYLRLTKILGEDLLNVGLNKERIALYQRFDRYHKKIETKRDLESLALDGQKPAAVAKLLDRLQSALDHLDKRVLLTDEDWGKFSDLEKHLAIWKEAHQQPFRWVNLSFLQARWYLFKLLKNKGKEATPQLLDQLRKDFAHHQKLQRLNGSWHQLAFFSDFPLLDTQKEKYRWLEQKQQHFEAWKELQAARPFPEIHPSLEQGVWNPGDWRDSMNWVTSLEAFTAALTDAQQGWRLWLHPEQMAVLDQGIRQFESIEDVLAQWSQRFEEDFHDLQSLDRQLAALDATGQQVLTLAEEALVSDLAEPEFRDLIRNSIYLHWLENLEQEHPILTEVSGRGWERTLREYREKYAQRQPAVAALVSRRLKENILADMEFNRLQNRVTYRDIQHQVKKKRRLWPLRRLISETWTTGLQRLAPCWLASPESAAAMFPMQSGLFDLVIFDEASQCFVERSLPVMLRGTQVVIAGDDKQLPPSDLYRVRYEDDPDLADDPVALEVVSVLDLARQTLPERRLSWHYRSESEALIQFSNDRFYDGTLQMIPPASISPLHQPAIVWESVAGEWRDNRNKVEANRVVELILTLAQRADKPTVGVVTFNFHQQELILDQLEQRMQVLAELGSPQYQSVADLLDRVSGEEQQGLFVKNIENVQGDERDVIIFSIAYAKDGNGKLQTRFGLLNQAGGENRLNVAVTRARWQVFVVCSFRPEELQVENSTQEGPRAFKAYLRYAWELSHGQVEKQSWQLHEDEGLCQRLRRRLEAEGYEVVSGLGRSGYQLDLAVRKRGEEAFLIGIECEGPRYFRGLSAKERDVYRPQLLRSKKWQVIRVWARNVWQDEEKEWQRVLKEVAKAENN